MRMADNNDEVMKNFKNAHLGKYFYFAFNTIQIAASKQEDQVKFDITKLPKVTG